MPVFRQAHDPGSEPALVAGQLTGATSVAPIPLLLTAANFTQEPEMNMLKWTIQSGSKLPNIACIKKGGVSNRQSIHRERYMSIYNQPSIIHHLWGVHDVSTKRYSSDRHSLFFFSNLHQIQAGQIIIEKKGGKRGITTRMQNLSSSHPLSSPRCGHRPCAGCGSGTTGTPSSPACRGGRCTWRRPPGGRRGGTPPTSPRSGT